VSTELVRVKLVRDIGNWDSTLNFPKDSVLLVDPNSAHALVMCGAAEHLPQSGPRIGQDQGAA
jgi:hypothetical protein